MPRVIVRDTAAELPTAVSALGGLFEGDLAVALDSGLAYYWDGSVWQPVSSGSSGITVEEVDGSPSLPATTILQFDQADGFVVSQPVAGTAKVKFSAGATAAMYRRWAFMFGGK